MVGNYNFGSMHFNVPGPPTVFRRLDRQGFSVIELIASAALLMTVMTFVTTLCIRINHVWKDVREQRIAVGELSNQLESFTRLNRDDAERQLKQLQPSEICAKNLRQAKLTGTLTDDLLGPRFSLTIQWQSRTGSRTVEIVGWLNPEKPESKNAFERSEPSA